MKMILKKSTCCQPVFTWAPGRPDGIFLLVFLSFFLWANILAGQESRLTQTFRFRNLGMAEGLSYSQIGDLHEDHFRLHRAALWLLEDPGRPVTSIAEAAGYSSHNYFDRDFKKVIGCSPSEYRKAGNR